MSYSGAEKKVTEVVKKYKKDVEDLQRQLDTLRESEGETVQKEAKEVERLKEQVEILKTQPFSSICYPRVRFR